MLLRFGGGRNDRAAVPGYADSCPKVQLPVRAAGTALPVVAGDPGAPDSGWMALARDDGPAPRAQRPHARTRRPPAPPLLALQSLAGNAAVSGLVAQRAAPPTTVTPAQDPKFRALRHDIAAKAKTAKAHPPASAEVKKAQDAAVAPPDDKDAQAKAAQVDKMAEAKPAGFDKAAFIAAVNAAIAKQAPKNLDEADKFATSGKADQLKSDVMGQVTAGKEQSAKDVADRTREAPDPSRAVEKPVKPMADAPPPAAIAPPDARKAVPDKAPAEQTDLSADKHETNARMAEAGVTEEQLDQSNEPEFTAAVAAKKQGEAHSDTAPAAVRASEAQTLAAATGDARATGQAAVAGLTGAKGNQARKSAAAKTATKSKDEQDRIRVTGELKAIFDETKTKVEAVLGGLDDEVAKRFESGEAKAKAAFTADHQARMAKYKDERYSGVSGAAAWAYDLFAGLPAEANDLFAQAKKVYEAQMQVVIGEVADHIGARLAEAKRLIAEGRERVKAKVADQPPALRKIAGDAAKDFEGQFEDLEKSVDEKQQGLVDDLAQKYVEARNAVDDEIKKLQEENKGLWDKAKEAVGGAIETIGKLKDMLLGVLARAAGAVELIIKDPIGFLGNLVNAVKTGVVNFGSRIAEHLKQGLKAWLLGNLASAGIEIPETFDVKGILRMVMSILGLTWANVRARIVRFIPEPVMARLEQTLDVVKIMVAEGLPGLWKWVVEKLGDLKELVIGQIKEFVVEKIVKAGITWIISMLNPAAAFIKACKAIYDVVMFFVDKAAQIKEFVDSVLDSIESIARGGVGAVAGLIENTLAKALPMVLGFLASLLGLGGISEKIKAILEKVQAPVGRVIDTVVGTVVKAGKKLLGKLKGKKADESPAAKQKRLDDGMTAAVRALGRFRGKPVRELLLKPILLAVKLRYRMTELRAVAQGRQWAVYGKVNPDETRPAEVKVLDKAAVEALRSAHDRVRRIVNDEIAALWKKNKVKSRLAADAKLSGELSAVKSRLDKAMDKTGRTEKTYQDLLAGRPTTADPDRMQAMYESHQPHAEQLRERLADLQKSDDDLKKEAEAVRKRIQAAHERATRVVAEASVQAVLALPSYAGLRTELDGKFTAVNALIAADRGDVKQLDQLRADLVQADRLRQDADRAKKLTDIARSIAVPIRQIDDICRNTTKEGREGASVGDGSAEAAAIQEVGTGVRVSNKMHGPKCRAEGNGLAGAIRKLRDLRTQTTDAEVLKRIDDAIKKAEERKTGLDRGKTAWEGRARTNPEVWSTATGESLNPADPGWGKDDRPWME